jgi:hypothetical protein
MARAISACNSGHSARQLPSLTAAAIAIALAITGIGQAHATESYCAVAKRTRDGFVALRAGPGTQYAVTHRLRAGEQFDVDTGQCRAGLCTTEDHKWSFVESIPALDKDPSHPTQGWVATRLTRVCKVQP